MHTQFNADVVQSGAEIPAAKPAKRNKAARDTMTRRRDIWWDQRELSRVLRLKSIVWGISWALFILAGCTSVDVLVLGAPTLTYPSPVRTLRRYRR